MVLKSYVANIYRSLLCNNIATLIFVRLKMNLNLANCLTALRSLERIEIMFPHSNSIVNNIFSY